MVDAMLRESLAGGNRDGLLWTGMRSSVGTDVPETGGCVCMHSVVPCNETVLFCNNHNRS